MRYPKIYIPSNYRIVPPAQPGERNGYRVLKLDTLLAPQTGEQVNAYRILTREGGRGWKDATGAANWILKQATPDELREVAHFREVATSLANIEARSLDDLLPTG